MKNLIGSVPVTPWSTTTITSGVVNINTTAGSMTNSALSRSVLWIIQGYDRSIKYARGESLRGVDTTVLLYDRLSILRGRYLCQS